MGYYLHRLVIFIKYGDIESFVASFMFIQSSQAFLSYLIDGTAHPLAPERLDAGNPAPPLAGPAGKYQLVIWQYSHKLGLLPVLSAFLHLIFT